VWPWLVQVGFHRADFYSYDLLDGLGTPSAERLLPEWQDIHVGDVTAPMTDPPTTATSFIIQGFRPPEHLVWSNRTRPGRGPSRRFTAGEPGSSPG
jgi:hypothetical protein